MKRDPYINYNYNDNFNLHNEIKRSCFDRLIGRNKRYDDICKVRSQIKQIKKKYLFSERNPFSLSMRDIDFRKVTNLINESILDENLCVNVLGVDILHNKFIDIRDELIDMLKDKIDLSDILSEIRDEKIKSLGI